MAGIEQGISLKNLLFKSRLWIVYLIIKIGKCDIGQVIVIDLLLISYHNENMFGILQGRSSHVWGSMTV